MSLPIARDRAGLRLSVLATAIALASAAYAQDGAKTETQLKTVKVQSAADGGADKGYQTEKVSGAGPWQGRKLQDTPYAITVFSEDLLKNLQATTPDQVLRLNPTTQLIRAQHENNQPRVMIRGFMVQKSFRDGVPDDQYSHTATMEDTAQIEILNGLSGFLYGANNVGGVVNYVTKSSTQERLNSVTLSSLGHESWYAHGDFGGKFDTDGRFGYRVNAVEQGGDTAIKGQEIEKTFYSLALDGELFDGFWVQLNAMDYTYDVNGSQTYWTLGPGVTRPSASKIDNDKSWGQPWTNRWYDYNRYGVNLKWTISENFGIRASYLDNRGERGSESTTNTINANNTYTQQITGVYTPGVDTLLSKQRDKGLAVYADLAFDTDAIKHKFIAGFQSNESWQYRMINPATRLATNAVTINLPGLPMSSPTYISRPTNIAPVNRGVRALSSHTEYRNLLIGDDITFTDQWSALLGAAYTTSIDKIGRGYDKSELTPSVSVLYKPVENVTTYASYIEALEAGVRAPDQQGALNVTNAGQVFEPLVSKQAEIGVKTMLGGVAINSALFQIEKGLQYYVPVTSSSVRFEQDGEQVHKGVELTATGMLTENISILGGFTWLDAEVKKQSQRPELEGKAPVDVAENIYKVRAEYTVPQLRNLSFSASAIYNGPSYGNDLNTDKVPSYTLFDIGTRYSFDVSGVVTTLRLDVQNLTNEHYWNGFNGQRIGDPRTVLLSATFEF